MGGYSCPPKKTWGSLWGPLRNSGGGALKLGGVPSAPPQSVCGGVPAPPPAFRGCWGGAHLGRGRPFAKIQPKTCPPPPKKKPVAPTPQYGSGVGEGQEAGAFLGGVGPPPLPPSQGGGGGAQVYNGGGHCSPPKPWCKVGGGGQRRGSPSPQWAEGRWGAPPPPAFFGLLFFCFFSL